jgi:hypothetical protein
LWVNRQFQPCTLDLFASENTTQLKRYVSRFHDPKAVAIDAWSQRWSGERSWINVDWDQLALFVGVPSRERSRLLAFPPARVLGSGLARVAGTSLAKGLKITG